jgi:hypothetical protein
MSARYLNIRTSRTATLATIQSPDDALNKCALFKTAFAICRLSDAAEKFKGGSLHPSSMRRKQLASQLVTSGGYWWFVI